MIQEFFKHVLNWQEIEGSEAAFRFKSIKAGNNIVEALYRIRMADADIAADCAPDPDTIRGTRDGTSKRGNSHGCVPRNQANNIVRPRQTDRGTIQSNADVIADCNRSIGQNADAEIADRPIHDSHAPVGSHVHYNASGHIQNGQCDEGSFVIVGDPVLSQLHNAGLAIPLPCNGPADGPPKYPIPCSIYRAISGNAYISRIHTPTTSELVPMPMPMPSGSRQGSGTKAQGTVTEKNPRSKNSSNHRTSEIVRGTVSDIVRHRGSKKKQK